MDLTFTSVLPEHFKTLFQDVIVKSEFGISLQSIAIPSPMDGFHALNLSQQKDNVNHFHMTGDPSEETCESAFRTGIYTLLLLAEKFADNGHSGIRFWYYFQSEEMRKDWNHFHGWIEVENELFISV